MAPPGLAEVTAETVYRNKQRVPDIGLSSALEYDYRVYALACEGGPVYVGTAHKFWVGRRIAGFVHTVRRVCCHSVNVIGMAVCNVLLSWSLFPVTPAETRV